VTGVLAVNVRSPQHGLPAGVALLTAFLLGVVHAAADQNHAYHLPGEFADGEAAPLLCAGTIGYRALRRSRLPAYGNLGIYGFAGSAHLAAQIAIHEGASVYVFSRAEATLAVADQALSGLAHDRIRGGGGADGG